MPFISEVGRVSDLTIYPIKGMRGIAVDTMEISFNGARGDRSHAYIMTDSPKTPNTLDTIVCPQLLQYTPQLRNPRTPKDSPIEVFTLEMQNFAPDDSELLAELSELCGHPLAALRMGRGLYHSQPLSLISLASISAIEASVGATIDPRRFRENITIDTRKGPPFEEDEWRGHVVSFGYRRDSAKIVVTKLDRRCKTINLDPETGKRNQSILQAVQKRDTVAGEVRAGYLGVYATVFSEGTIQKGDPVIVSY